MSSVYALGLHPMQDLHPENALETLLEALQGQVLEDPAVFAEWQAATATFPFAADPGAHSRFLQWFLLERPSESLGSPPALVWAPDPLPEASPWSRLLGSFYGFFEVLEAQSGSAVLGDLATLRRFLVHPAPPSWEAGPEFLILARLALEDGEGQHFRPLPGFVELRLSGMVAAMAEDLAMLREGGKGNRLSQVVGEELILRAHSGALRKPPSLTQRFETLERELGLPPGCSEEQPQTEPVGPREALPFESFQESFLWERAVEGRPASASEKRTLQAFQTYLMESAPESPEPLNWHPSLVCGFFLAAPDPSACREQVRGLRAFLIWAEREQGAPLETLNQELAAEGKLPQQLPRIVELNHDLPKPSGRIVRTRLRTVSPWRLCEPDAAWELWGMPERAREFAQPGDWLLGSRDPAGKGFLVHALLPGIAFAEPTGKEAPR